MDKPVKILSWVGAGVLGGVLLVWAFPRAFPFYPQDWQISKQEATAIALERFRDLGAPVEKPYLVAHLSLDPYLERRLLSHDQPQVRDSRLAERVVEWVVVVYPPAAGPGEWTYRASVTTRGSVTSLLMRVPPELAARSNLPEADARAWAAQFLAEQGFDLTQLEAPDLRLQDQAAYTTLSLRYRDRARALGDAHAYGVEVSFHGDQLAGFSSWFEDADGGEITAPVRTYELFYVGWLFIVFPLLPFAAVAFLRRYHEGLIGVRRGVQIFVVAGLGAAVTVALTARAAAEGVGIPPLTRAQVTWVWTAQMIIIFYPALCALAFFGWSVGESFCREHLGGKLAAFDALFKRQWGNATVAASSLRGVVSGLVLASLLVAATPLLGRVGAFTQVSFLFGPSWQDARWPGIALLAVLLVYTLSYGLFGRLLLLSFTVRRFGPWLGGLAVALVTGLIFFPPLVVLPVAWGLVLWIGCAGALVALFLIYDLLTTLLAALVSQVVLGGLTLILAQDPTLQLQGWLAVLGASLPLWISLRHLGSPEVLTYAYDDIPPHVRRIAQRERQRVEIETARRIQSSILPDLPPQLAGVEIAHTYQPATEVGGDFYDVLMLEDGRLAVAVGDVAGHGVSSGLVMAMTRSALAVQVTLKPDVGEVFTTLNRVVYQSARRRLLTTLCYAVLDPKRRELVYASAGHLFPYQVSPDGRVVALESVAYPLGVRQVLEIQTRRADLNPGDSLFLSSDGLVEGRGRGELFGFERLESSLARHAGKGARALRDGVLGDLKRFVVGHPQEDDLTVLVLHVP